MRSRLMGAAVLTAIAVGMLAFGEFAMRLVLNSNDFLITDPAPDPVRGHRIGPGVQGHDAQGFRNSEVLKSPDLITIGDSMTYGVLAPMGESWPAHLSRQLKLPVYNLGLGGYGPLQYLDVARTEGRKAQAKTWLVAFYVGNDMMDAYNTSHDLESWASWRLSARPKGQLLAFDVIGASATPQKRFESMRHWLARNSMIYSAVRVVLQPYLARGDGAQATGGDRDMLWSFASPNQASLATAFQPKPMLAAVDLAQPEVAEGLRLTERVLGELQREAASQQARLLVVIQPTKEAAYCARLLPTGDLPAAHRKLCELEPQLIAKLVTAARDKGIAVHDLTPDLAKDLAEGRMPYRADRDGHFTGAGNALMAGHIAAFVKAQPAVAKPVP